MRELMVFGHTSNVTNEKCYAISMYVQILVTYDFIALHLYIKPI